MHEAYDCNDINVFYEEMCGEDGFSMWIGSIELMMECELANCRFGVEEVFRMEM